VYGRLCVLVMPSDVVSHYSRCGCLPERVRLVAAPAALRDVELVVLGWRTEDGETALICRLVDGSSGTIPARWTDLPSRGVVEPRLVTVATPEAWRLLASGWRGCWSVVRAAVEPAVKTEVAMSGQLALVMSETVVPAAVWETLPPASRQAIAVALARLVGSWRQRVMSELGKVTEEHRRRRAVVYVRRPRSGRWSATSGPRRGSTGCGSGRSSWGG
jgi:hypothetical protein